MDDLAEAGIALCQAYQDRGEAAFVLHCRQDGNISVIGLQLQPQMIAQMMRTAADVYESAVVPETVN